ncbi:hypothetical protein DL96DRAFT_1554100 [Flagelloscypha sp. PMI_526]|nr:hypothetical protein DL96DRAFT_1554100 [Flagelloscypha sp. PMI_526]
MVHIPVYERQVLQNRQIFGDGGALDKLLDDTTTAAQGNTRVAGAAAAAATDATTTTNTNTRLASQTTATETSTTSTTSRVAQTLPTVSTTTTSSSSTSVTTTSSSSTLPTTTSTPLTTSTTSTPPPQSTSTVPAGIQIVTVSSSSPASSPSVAPNGAAAAPPQPFLQNTAAKAAVFSIAGLVGLGLLIFIISLIVRRVRQKRLVEDAVSFNPSDLLDHRSMHDVERVNSRSSIEKAPYYGSDSGHSNYSRGGGVAPTYAATYDYNQPTYDYNQPTYDYNGQGYYASQQQQAYGGYNNNPVQLPSQNVGRGTPPPLLPTMGTPQEAALRSGGSGYLGGPNPPGLQQQQQQGSSIRRSPSGTGSIVDNPYVGTNGYKHFHPVTGKKLAAWHEENSCRYIHPDSPDWAKAEEDVKPFPKCRYYDPKTGQKLDSSHDPSRCRFIHPSDREKWDKASDTSRGTQSNSVGARASGANVSPLGSKSRITWGSKPSGKSTQTTGAASGWGNPSSSSGGSDAAGWGSSAGWGNASSSTKDAEDKSSTSKGWGASDGGGGWGATDTNSSWGSGGGSGWGATDTGGSGGGGWGATDTNNSWGSSGGGGWGATDTGNSWGSGGSGWGQAAPSSSTLTTDAPSSQQSSSKKKSFAPEPIPPIDTTTSPQIGFSASPVTPFFTPHSMAESKGKGKASEHTNPWTSRISTVLPLSSTPPVTPTVSTKVPTNLTGQTTLDANDPAAVYETLILALSAVVTARQNWNEASTKLHRWHLALKTPSYQKVVVDVQMKLNDVTGRLEKELQDCELVYKQRMRELEKIPYSEIMSAEFDETTLERDLMDYVHDLRTWIAEVGNLEHLFPANSPPPPSNLLQDEDGDEDMEGDESERDDSSLPWDQRIHKRIEEMRLALMDSEDSLNDKECQDKQYRMFFSNLFSAQAQVEDGQLQEIANLAAVLDEAEQELTNAKQPLEDTVKSLVESEQELKMLTKELEELKQDEVQLRARLADIEAQDAAEELRIEKLTQMIEGIQEAQQQRVNEATVAAYLPELQRRVKYLVNIRVQQAYKATEHAHVTALEQNTSRVTEELDHHLLNNVPDLSRHLTPPLA